MDMQFAQLFDRVELADHGAPIEFSQWVGTWINSNPDTTGIARLIISEVDGKFFLEVQAVGPDGPIAWRKGTRGGADRAKADRPAASRPRHRRATILRWARLLR